MEGRGGLSSSFRFLSLFAAGRLVGYVAVGAAAGAAAPLLSFILKGHFLAVVYLTLAVFLALWALARLRKTHTECRASNKKPFFFGLINGLCICPPFLAGIIFVMGYGSVVDGVALFLGFFIGATAPLLLFAFSGALGRLDSIRRVGLVVSLLLAFGLAGQGAALLAQNTTDRRTEEERLKIFRELIPDAASFSSNLAQREAPPYYAAYDEDRKVIAILFFTDEVAPEVEGYAGRVPACVACDLNLRIKTLKFLPNNETEDLVAEMFTDEFAHQFIGKAYTDRFEAGVDVKGISGATYTTEAINRSLKLSLTRIAVAYRPEEIEAEAVSLWSFDRFRTAVIVVFFVIASVLFLLAAQKLRLLLLAVSTAVLGFYLSAFMLTTDNITNIFTKGRIPQRVEFVVLAVGALLTSFLFGRLFCGYICPFGAVSELLWRVLPFRRKLSARTASFLRWVKYALLVALIVLASLGSKFYFAGTLEPFAPVFLGAPTLLLVLALSILFLSSVFFRFYCRFLCPVGAVMELLAYTRIVRRKVPASCKTCGACVKGCPTEALTIKDGAVRYNPALCFNCADCAETRKEKECEKGRSVHPGTSTSLG